MFEILILLSNYFIKIYMGDLMKKLFFLISIFFFAVSITAVAQEQSQEEEFPVGAFVGCCPSPEVLASYDSSGMNWIELQARESTKDFLENYEVIPFNLDSTDWINHYATASYSKWESEENQTDTFKLGVKHILSDGTIVGQVATWKNKLCWSSQGLTGPQDSLVYGPHYFQAKIYRRVYP